MLYALLHSGIAADYPYQLIKENHGDVVRSLLVNDRRCSEIDQFIVGLGPKICMVVKEPLSNVEPVLLTKVNL